MILLTSITDLIQIVTGGTQIIDVHASWVDLNSSSAVVTPGRQNTIISTAATTTVVPVPAATVFRNLKTLIIENTDAAVADTVTVKHTDGTNVVTLISLSLLPGYVLTWTEEVGWSLTDNFGRLLENVAGPDAVGATPIANPFNGAVVTPAGTLARTIGSSFGALGVGIMSNENAVLTNATITANGSAILGKNFWGVQQILCTVAIDNAPTGTTPTIQFFLYEVDPGDLTTTYGNVISSPILSAAGVTQLVMQSSISNAFKVMWVVSGAGASFTGVYVNVFSKATPGTVAPDGAQSVQSSPDQLFNDAFDTGVLDTTNRWNAVTTAGAGSSTITSGSFTLLSGTTASGFANISTQPTFPQASPGRIAISHNIAIEFPVLTNAYRFWGAATIPATPTAAAPLTDAYGWEVTTAGKLFAICWASGVRSVVLDLSVATGNGKQPQDANTHRYNVLFRGDQAWWLIDGYVVAQMFTGSQGPNNNNLPIRMITIANSTPPASTANITAAAVYLGVTNSPLGISDGVYQFRAATVLSGNASSGLNPTNAALVTSPSFNTSVTSAVTAANAATAVLAQNLKRRQYIIDNDSAATMWVLEGTGTVAATRGNYTYRIAPGASSPAAVVQNGWTGPVSAIWTGTINGGASVTEYTP